MLQQRVLLQAAYSVACKGGNNVDNEGDFVEK
jgi:hypothetical protein